MFDSFGAHAVLRESGLDLRPSSSSPASPGKAWRSTWCSRGSIDYIVKGSLKRLAPALKRALEAADTRPPQARGGIELRHSEERLRELTLHMVQAKEYERC